MNDDADDWLRESQADDTTARDASVAELSATWQAQQAKRADAFERALLDEHPHAREDEKVLLNLAAHDAALNEVLGRAEVELAERTAAMVDNPKIALALARTLKEVMACRTAATQRVEQLLRSAGVLRAQRHLANVTPIRRVA